MIPARFQGCVACRLPDGHTHNGRGPSCPRWPYEATGAPLTAAEEELVQVGQTRPLQELDASHRPGAGTSHAGNIMAMDAAREQAAWLAERRASKGLTNTAGAPTL